MSSKKGKGKGKEKKKKKKVKAFGRHKKHAKTTPGNPFDDTDEDSLASSSDFEDFPDSEPMVGISASSHSSDERNRRDSLGGHRPAPLRQFGRDDSLSVSGEADEVFFKQGHVRSRSNSLSGLQFPVQSRSDSDEEGDGGETARRRRLTDRSKTKMFDPKTTFLEQETQLKKIQNGVARVEDRIEEISETLNTIKSIESAILNRAVTLQMMASEISRGAEYYMKDRKSSPYGLVEPLERRKEPQSCWSCAPRPPEGYKMIPKEERQSRLYPDDEEEGEGEAEAGCLCFS